MNVNNMKLLMMVVVRRLKLLKLQGVHALITLMLVPLLIRNGAEGYKHSRIYQESNENYKSSTQNSSLGTRRKMS